MTPASRGLRIDQSLDVRGLKSPEGNQQAIDRLLKMAEDDILELSIDEGEALRTIPYALRAEGHEIVVSEPTTGGIRLLVRKRTLLT